MAYFIIVALLMTIFLALTYATRRIVLLLVLNGIAITQVVGACMMEFGLPGFEIPEFGYINYSTATMLVTLIGLNLAAFVLPTRVTRPAVDRRVSPRDSATLLTLAVVVLSTIVGAVTIALGAPLFNGATDISRAQVVAGNGSINYLRSYVIPVLATLAWYQSRFFARGTGGVLRAILLCDLIANGVLIASKSSVVTYPIIIVVIELTYYFQHRRSILSSLKTWAISATIAVTALAYMVVLRFFHAAGSLSIVEAANSLGLRLVLAQGDIYWKIFTEPGALRGSAGRVWLNVLNTKYVLAFPPQFEFFRAVALRYTNDYFAEYWNLVATFLGEPVLLFGTWAIPIYMIIVFAVLGGIHISMCRALSNNRMYSLALTTFYSFVLINYWQMGGLYAIFSVKNAMVALGIVGIVKALREAAVAFGSARIRLPISPSSPGTSL